MIKEPKPSWTWYDYKMECVRVLITAGFDIRTEPVLKEVVVRKGNITVLTYPKRGGWKNFYYQYLKGIVEKDYSSVEKE
jgi:hypothetical protein